jgi:ferric-dicitrate binding protein FerR (iron transport regulator)
MTQETGDPIWNTAWDWVQREHDRESFDEAARAAMTAWLLAEPAHRLAYDKAARLWLLAGFVPPVNDVGDDLPDADAEPRAGK